jgi:hypothetical protein
MIRRVLSSVTAAVLVYTATTLAEEPKIEFNRDVRPILSDKCFFCHGPDEKKRKSGLRLDLRDGALKPAKSGDPAIVPGNAAESELVRRIFSDDKEEVMPPEEEHKALTQAQKETLKRWIAQGAEYQQHWAYITPRRPAVPGISDFQLRIADWEKRDAARGADLRKRQGEIEKWVRNPIDAFVLDRHLKEGLAPSREADPRTLCRRLYLDLIGIPPAREQTETFLQFAEATASGGRQTGEPIHNLSDALLDSPHFGERMAVPWLDAVRFADTVGFHGDQRINIFPYRDYVIDAFNKNKRFDQFTIEQLAGDLLPNPTEEQLIATGFNRLNMVTREGGAQPKEYLAKYGADRVRTVASAWLGSSMACCECHDHKFDPFTSRDFYSLSAFFADVKQWGVYQDYDYTPNPELRGWSNDHPFPPELEVESAALKQRQEVLGAQISQLVGKLDGKQQAEFSMWHEQALAFLKEAPTGWTALVPAKATQTAATKPAKKVAKAKPATVAAKSAEPVPEEPAPPRPEFKIEDDGRVVFTAKAATKTTMEFSAPVGWLAAVRIEVLPDATHGGNILRGNARSGTFKPVFTFQKAGGNAVSLAIRQADADHKVPRYFNGFERRGIGDGWSVANAEQSAIAVWLLDQPVQGAEGDRMSVVLDGNVAASLRVSVSPFAAPTPTADWTALAKAVQSDGASARAIWLASTASDPARYAQFKALADRVAECRNGRAMTLVTKSAPEPPVTRVLARGNWQDESGEIVKPAPPRFLAPSMDPDVRRLTRLDLAKWLVAPENPLTARVFVNRLWKQFFGNAISAQVNDLGAQGEWPTHPELLDWLAVEFRESGWDVKHMVKLIVTSATYRQDSNLHPELRETDPDNRLLASQNPRRLEAEFVRDNALSIAGLLNLEIGGPSALPYQPANYYENLQFPDREYLADKDERQYRRGVYTHWQRTFLHPMLANFDAPSREETACTRTVANTPQQALTLLDDPTFVEAARAFATKLLAAPANTDAECVALAYAQALAREPKEKETRSLTNFLAMQREYFRAHPDDANKLLRVGLAPIPAGLGSAEQAAWTSVCRVLLNLHETITRY